MKLKLAAASILLSGVFFASCSTSSEQKVKNAKDDLEEANEAYLEEMENYKAEKWAIIKANEVALADFKSNSTQEGTTMTEEYEELIADLEERNEAMKVKLKDYEDEGETKWKSFKKEFSHDMDELGTAFKDIFKNSNK